MKIFFATFDNYKNSKHSIRVSEEKMYQHADPGPWVHSIEELKELYSSLL